MSNVHELECLDIKMQNDALMIDKIGDIKQHEIDQMELIYLDY